MTGFSISEDLLQAENAARKRRSTRTTPPWARAGPPGHRHRRADTRGHGVRRRDPDLGRRHRRHPLRALSRPRRAAPSVRQARGLRHHPPADAGNADRLAAFSVGRDADYAALARKSRPSLGLGFDAMNSNTFQDQPDQAHSYKFGSLSHADPAVRAAGDRAQHRMHRDRPPARLEGADGLDRRRRQFPRPVEPDPRARSLSRLRCARSTRRCPTTGGCSSSTSCTSRRSTPP